MPQIPWLHWPQFVALAILGFVAFSILGFVGVWTKNHGPPTTPNELEEAGKPFWMRDVPWYWFVLIYFLTVGASLFVLIRFIGT